jgi:hypothetical protein
VYTILKLKKNYIENGKLLSCSVGEIYCDFARSAVPRSSSENETPTDAKMYLYGITLISLIRV